jgi:hypothetical protein
MGLALPFPKGLAMASLQCRPGRDDQASWRILSRYKDRLHGFTLDDAVFAAPPKREKVTPGRGAA